MRIRCQFEFPFHKRKRNGLSVARPTTYFEKKFSRKMSEKSCQSELQFSKKLTEEIKQHGFPTIVALVFECGWGNIAQSLIKKHGLCISSLTEQEWKTAFGWEQLHELPDQVLGIFIDNWGIEFEHLVASVFKLEPSLEKRLEYYENADNQDDSCFFYQLLAKCVDVELGTLSECCRRVRVCHCENKKRYLLTEEEIRRLNQFKEDVLKQIFSEAKKEKQ